MKIRSFISERSVEHIESLETVSRANCNVVAFRKRLYTENVS